MKPIFKQEIEFFKSKTGVELPQDCWRDGTKIYLNSDKKDLLINFKVDKRKIIIKKNNISNTLENVKNKTIQEEISENAFKLDELEKQSIKMTVECMNEYHNSKWRISDSGGKDSAICMHIFKKSLIEYDKKYDFEVDFFNTSNDTADTYKQIKRNIKNNCDFVLKNTLKRSPTKEELDDLIYKKQKQWIHNPEMGWYQWLKDVKNYYLPSIMVRNCCSTYKEGKLKNVMDKKENYVTFLGMRKYESSKRAEYDWYLNDAMNKKYNETGKSKYKLNVPENWVRFLPIVEWKDEEIWLYMIREGIEFNPMYKKGFNRVGCLICPYMSDYVDLLVEEFYNHQWKRWNGIVEINYDLFNVENRLKWTKDEYILHGKWKQSTSKLYEYITKKDTDERVKMVSEILGTSEDIARKYFKKNCNCGKKMNPDEIGMFLKLYGRYEDKIDDRNYLCKECLCKDLGITKDEYSEKVREFRNQGCNLF